MPLLEEGGWLNLAKIFNEIRLPSLKSDIARYVWLYNHGGLYADTHCALRARPLDLARIFDNNYDALIAMWGKRDGTDDEHGMRNSVLMAKPRSKFFKMWLDEAASRIVAHFNVECLDTNFHQYNIASLSGQIIVTDAICKGQDVCRPRRTGNTTSMFYEMSCVDYPSDSFACFNPDAYFGTYSIGFDLNHGVNMNNHWSVRQSSERLFNNASTTNKIMCPL